MKVVMMDYKNWCVMLSVMGVIDGLHISIAKLSSVFYEDYYHKIRGCNIGFQIMVDSHERCMDAYVALLAQV
jgi:hypothetical protein